VRRAQQRGSISNRDSLLPALPKCAAVEIFCYVSVTLSPPQRNSRILICRRLKMAPAQNPFCQQQLIGKEVTALQWLGLFYSRVGAVRVAAGFLPVFTSPGNYETFIDSF
jgi:hypothetical protein